MNNNEQLFKDFNILFLDENTKNSFLKEQVSLQNGIILNINLIDFSIKNIKEEISKKIKKEIAMCDNFIFNELIDFKYHIHYNSKVSFTIKNFNNKELFNKIDNFENIIHLLTHDFQYVFDQITNIGYNQDQIIISLKVLEEFNKMKDFVNMVNNNLYNSIYLQKIIFEVLKQSGIKLDFSKIKKEEPELILDVLIMNPLITQRFKSNIMHFKETNNLFFLLKLCNHNFWKNSNF